MGHTNYTQIPGTGVRYDPGFWNFCPGKCGYIHVWSHSSADSVCFHTLNDTSGILHTPGDQCFHAIFPQMSQNCVCSCYGGTFPVTDPTTKTEAIRSKARELLESGQVGCVIGYELGPRQRTRPTFVYSSEETARLVWNPDCSHNLTSYLPGKLKPNSSKKPAPAVAVIVKPCDSRAINVQLAENLYRREQVYAIGLTCEGVRDKGGFMQARCIPCQEAAPVVCDSLIEGDTSGFIPRISGSTEETLAELEHANPAERMEFWLSQFDRCIRCYACRQACPLCNCPTCLYEQDDSTWVGLGIGMNEKRTFHLGRAYHLAGRCVGCNFCEQACPMDIPISLLNQKLAGEIEKAFGFRAGLAVASSPIVTVLPSGYQEE